MTASSPNSHSSAWQRMSAMLILKVASDAVLDEAYTWVCHRRRNYPANAHIWSLRRHWPVEKDCLQRDHKNNRYRFDGAPAMCIALTDGSIPATDARPTVQLAQEA